MRTGQTAPPKFGRPKWQRNHRPQKERKNLQCEPSWVDCLWKQKKDKRTGEEWGGRKGKKEKEINLLQSIFNRIDQHSATDSRGTLCRCLMFSLCSAFTSPYSDSHILTTLASLNPKLCSTHWTLFAFPSPVQWPWNSLQAQKGKRKWKTNGTYKNMQ